MDDKTKKKSIRHIPAFCAQVSANQSNETGISVKGVSGDSEIIGWIMRHKPGIEKTALTVTCDNWESQKLHDGELPLICVSSPWDKEPKAFLFEGDYPLKANGNFKIKIRAIDAISAGDIAFSLIVRLK